MNNINITIVFILVQFSLIGTLQSQNFNIEYTGSGSAIDITGNETFSYTKTSGGNITYFCFEVPMPKSISLEHNSQSVSDHFVNSNINYSNYDMFTSYEGNLITKIEFQGSNLNYISLGREYNAYTNVSIPQDCFTDEYPLTIQIPIEIQEYLDPSTNIQSDNYTIHNLAQSIVSGCFLVQDAVEKIAMWVRGNIIYSSTGLQDALSVYNRNPKSGDCKGFTNIMIALLRSIGIPARYVSSVLAVYGYNVPYKTNGYIILGDDGPGFHAVCEIYYPSIMNWVSNDPQSSLHHNSTNCIRINHVVDQADTGIKTIINYTGIQPQLSFSSSVQTSIGFASANYTYETEKLFGGSLSGQKLISAHLDCNPTGIYDEVEIVSAPDHFKTGESVLCNAQFTSGNGDTYPVNWSWQIRLYHSGGTYLLCSENNGLSFWYPTTPPLLPSYNWLIDPVGKIYGEIVVEVSISDGDWRTATLPVSVEECQGIYITNQTYSSNTTVQGCFITLENVNIQNGAKLTLDSEMGIRIVKDFNVALGSEFVIQ